MQFTTTITSFAQTTKSADIFVTPYSIEEGLRQSMVKQVYLDSRGLIWMVTGDGLHLFNGKTFRVFRVPNISPFSQSDNVMRNIIETTPGHFVVTSSSSLSIFDADSGNFRIIRQQPGLYPQLFTSLINGKPLTWMLDMGYCFVDNSSLLPLKLLFDKGNLPIQSFIPLQILEISSKRFIIQGVDGLIEVTINIENSNSTFHAKWIPLSKDCLGIASNGKSRILLLSGTKVYTYHEGGTIEPYIETDLDDNNSIFIDSDDNIWFSNAKRKEVYKITNRTLQKVNLFVKEGRHSEIINPFVINFFEDSQKNIWIGTDGEGVLKYQSDQLQFNKSNIGFVRCINSWAGHIWAGTFQNGLWRISNGLEQAQRMFPSRFNNNTDILDITSDNYNRLWVATANRLEVIDINGNQVFSYPLTISVAKFFNGSRGQVLLSTNNNLLTFCGKQNPSLLSNDRHYHFTSWVSHKGREWIGTSSGLFAIKSGLGLDLELFNSAKVSPLEVKSLQVIKNQIWVASNAGIDVFGEGGQRISDFNILKKFKNEVIYSLLPDSSHRIWFSSNNGIGCISSDIERVNLFKSSNNLQSLEFNSNAFFVSQDGVFYFGGIHGINGIDPSQFKPIKALSKPTLISLNTSDTIYSKGIAPKLSNLNLNWRESNISGTIFSTDYLNVDEQYYSCMLENYDDRWSQPALSTSFSYRNLRPGHYRLLVKYQDSFQNWSKPTLLLSLNIKPPIWETWWFIILLISSVIGLTVLIVKKIQGFRYRNRIIELEHQNAVEKERLRISRDLHDELGAGLSLIMLNSSIAQNQLDDKAQLGAFLQTISRNSKELYENMNNLIWLLKQENHSLDALFSRIREVVSDMLEDSGFEYVIHIPECFEDIVINRDTSRQIYLITKEAVNNAIKHSDAKKITVEAIIINNHLTIQIIDNGKGFTNESEVTKGNGLMNMKSRAKQLSGNLSIISAISNGSTVTLSLNLDEIKG